MRDNTLTIGIGAVKSSLSSPHRTLGLCLAEARPQVLGIFALRFTVGATLAAAPGGMPVHRVLAAGLVWSLAVFFVYLFNGVTDVRADRANGSTRPIARGALYPTTALAVASGAALAAVLGALLLGGVMIALVTALLALGYAYSAPPFNLKRHSGSTAATGMAGTLLTYLAGLASLGTVTVGDIAPCVTFVLFACLWMGLVGTLAKDLPDIAGDVADGRRSLAARLGEKKTRAVLSVVALVIAGCFTLVAPLISWSLIIPALAMLRGAITVATAARDGGKSLQHPYRVFMLTQYGIHICLLTALVILVPFN